MKYKINKLAYSNLVIIAIGIYTIENASIPVKNIKTALEIYIFFPSSLAVHKNLKIVSVICNVNTGPIKGIKFITKFILPYCSVVKYVDYRGYY